MTSSASFPLEGGFACRQFARCSIQKRTPRSCQKTSFERENMRLLLFSLSVVCLLVVISAKKQIPENIDQNEAETKGHSSKKYSKDYQKSHHHHGGHKHKKYQVQDEPKQVDPEPKTAHAGVPEPEIQLQSDIVTSKKAIEEQKQKTEVEDLHLQDLTYEENLKKDKKKKKGHHTESAQKQKDQKLFAEQKEKSPVEEKVIEDSFEPLKETRSEAEKKTKGKDKSKTKTKKKAFEKNKEKSKKSKDGKKKNKDKKNKHNKDKKKW